MILPVIGRNCNSEDPLKKEAATDWSICPSGGYSGRFGSPAWNTGSVSWGWQASVAQLDNLLTD
ncbi:hypothetical protein MPTK1_2g10450 [Marchantia polymorpha subsp. ruderalis]